MCKDKYAYNSHVHKILWFASYAIEVVKCEGFYYIGLSFTLAFYIEVVFKGLPHFGKNTLPASSQHSARSHLILIQNILVIAYCFNFLFTISNHRTSQQLYISFDKVDNILDNDRLQHQKHFIDYNYIDV